jgi:hypothetical protein
MIHKKVTVLALFIVAGLLVMGVRNRSIPVSSDPYALYQDKIVNNKKTDFHFTDHSDLIGSRKDDPNNVFTLSNVISDYDNDGFEDILLVNYDNASGGTGIKILKNMQGKNFKEATSEVLQLPPTIDSISAIAMVDLDNDGWKDLYIGRFMKPHLVLKNNHGKFNFNSQIAIDEVIQPTRGIYLLDYNRDGFVDIYLSSFSQTVYSLLFNYSMAKTEVDFPVRNQSGSQNVLLMNNKGERLVKKEKALGAEDGGFTWAVGIEDFNNDGYPDLYVANDFGFDHFYENVKGEKFVEKSKEALGNIRSENAMGVEIGDVDNSGNKGIYISNASKPGMPRGWNHFWKYTNEKSAVHFKDEAKNISIDKCGFSWGSRFVDINKDGLLDLFVVNGRTGKAESNSNRWYYRQYEWNLPPAFKFLENIHIPFNGYSFAQGQKNCFFLNNGKDFDDVAENSGITDLENGRSVTMIDYNNSGQESFVLGNYMHDPIFYTTERSNQNHWVGLILEGTESNKDGIGANLSLVTDSMTQHKSLYPTNGFSNQSSSRILFGIPAAQKAKSIEVKWPSGKISILPLEKVDQYYKIKE